MHKFSRGLPPVRMDNVKARYHNQWCDDFCKSEEHALIGDSLYERQSHHCAYCDSRIKVKEDGFVEHLERRSDNPARTFDWSNMFFSCRNKDSCGKYKDDSCQRFLLEDIVDPSVEDPLDFFIFDLDGGISPKDTDHEHRAKETIRVFNLDHSPRLKNIRVAAAKNAAYFLEHNPSDEDITNYLNALGDCDCPSVYYCLLKRKAVS